MHESDCATPMSTDEKLRRELESFSGLWKGGYFNDVENTPDRRLRAVYGACLAPYVNGATVLEIGPGRGGWTKKILAGEPAKVYCLDVVSAEHNCFWEYVGLQAAERVEYHTVTDFSCSALPDNSINYVFSFGVFCHISYSGISEYLKNLRPKLAPGANCFIMFADADKYRGLCGNNGFVCEMDGRAYASYDGDPSPGRWYWVGTERFCDLLRSLGYEVVAPDVNVYPRDPICHFVWNP